LDTLHKCLKLDKLRKALRSLPKTLDDTYAQILLKIDEDYSQDALKILQWLVHSARPLRIEEIAEVIAVDTDNKPGFDPERRLWNPEDVLRICSSLVTTTISKIGDFDRSFATMITEEAKELRLAHFFCQRILGH
jgi:hypothetical protein